MSMTMSETATEGGDASASDPAGAGASGGAEGGKRNPLKSLGVLAALVALVMLARKLPLEQAVDWVEGLGPWGPVALGGIYIVSTVLALPGSILTIAAGGLFGVALGSVTVLIGATLGATAAFLVGRYLARDAVAGRVAGNERFAAIDRAVGKEGFKIVGLTRLSPIFPFNLLNYGYGLTSVTLRDYFFASLFGMIPGTVMYVYLGSALGEALLSSERERTTGEWVLFGGGLAAAIIVSIFVAKVARRALDEQTGDDVGKHDPAVAGNGTVRPEDA